MGNFSLNIIKDAVITIYPNYNSLKSESYNVSTNSLKNLKFNKVAKYYKKIELDDFYNFISITKGGFSKDVESYNSFIDNFDTDWFLYLESDTLKGWIREYQDYRSLGFNEIY